MKKLFNITNIIAGATFCLAMSSCEDYLTITPTDRIVEEEFWQDKNDLNNAINACYKRLASDDILTKFVYWGEMRSDNFERSTETTSTGQVANIMNANLLPTYNVFEWTNMYNAINYCNKVLSHGKDIVELDESFNYGDWYPVRAEMIALRALCHFYLVRTFGEIPYVTKDYNNDSEELRQTQITQLQVLDSIINDLEEVKDAAMLNFGNTVQNKGRITKKTIYTILADVYLWRASYKAGNCHPFINRTIPSYNVLYTDGVASVPGDSVTYSTSEAESDYRKCIECCDVVIDLAKAEKKKQLKNAEDNVKIEDEDLLEQNTSMLETLVSTSNEGAYNSIFGTGNSDESIFELQFDGLTYENNMTENLYYSLSKSKVGTFTGSTSLFENIESTPNVTEPASVFTKTDYRRCEAFDYKGQGQTSYDIIKYVNSYFTISTGLSTLMTDNTSKNQTIAYTRNTSHDANWIIYRMSEVFLMKAEAMSQIYSDEENIHKAFNYVREVFKRSNPYAYSTSNNSSTAKSDSLDFNTFNDQESLEKLIMTERQREFIGEGKRWFDLVRYAQRRGSTEDMLKLLTRKYSTNSKSIQAKLADIQSLFSPIYESELKSNTWLYQNGVWEINKSSGRTDNL